MFELTVEEKVNQLRQPVSRKALGSLSEVQLTTLAVGLTKVEYSEPLESAKLWFLGEILNYTMGK